MHDDYGGNRLWMYGDEHACHEGNHGMFNLLAGARAEEQAAKAARSK